SSPTRRSSDLLEAVDAVDLGHGRRRQRTDGGDQEAAAMAAAVLQGDLPTLRFFMPVSSGNPALELDVAAQVEFVGDVIEVFQRLRLGREKLRAGAPVGEVL